MKIVLILIARFEYGGIPIQAFMLAKFLKRHNFHPIILAQYLHDISFVDLLKGHNIEFDYLNDSIINGRKVSNFKYFFDLINRLNLFKPDYILPFNKHLSFHVNLIWRFTFAKKSFFMERGHGVEKFNSFFDFIMKYFCWLNTSGIIYNSHSASLNSRFLNKTFVVKNAYRRFNFAQQSNFSFPFSQSDFVFLHVANIFSSKNYSLLIQGWKLIIADNPDFKLIVIGSDLKNENKDLINSFSELGVLYLGSVSDISPYLRRSNVCLLSTFQEGCPNVILEYMDSEKLIAASNIPALREVLTPMNHKFLFDNQSPEDFRDKILAICELPHSKKIDLITMNKQKLVRDYSESNYERIICLINE